MTEGIGITPRNDLVFVRLQRPYAEYTGPLAMPDNIEADVMGQRLGTVVAVGPGAWVKGSSSERIPIPLRVGETVILDQIATRGAWPEVAPGVHAIPWYQLLAGEQQ